MGKIYESRLNPPDRIFWTILKASHLMTANGVILEHKLENFDRR